MATERQTKIVCKCYECGLIHAEFIMHFGRWPNLTHEEGQELKRRREENLASWDRIERNLRGQNGQGRGG